MAIICFKWNSIEVYKMNKIVNKFLLAGDIFMPKMHLKQPGFTCGPFNKNKEYKYLKKQEIQKIFTEMSLIKLAFNMISPKEILNI